MRILNQRCFGTLFLLGLVLTGCSSPDEKEARYLKRGNELFEQGEFEKARVEYKNAGRIKPADAEVIYRVGMVDEAEGNIRAAFADFGHAEEQNAHFRPALLKLAEYYLANQQFAESKKRIDIVLADTPNDAEAHALKAGFLASQRDFAGAETEGRFALAQDQANITAYTILSSLYLAQNDATKAADTIEEGIAKNPQSVALLLLKASISERSHNMAKVNEAYQQIFKLKPKERRFHSDLANIDLKAGQIDDAEAALHAGVVALPDDWEMKHQLVEFLGDQRSVDVAEKEIRSYMETSPKEDDLSSWLIDLYVRHNAVDRAIAFLNQSIDKNQFNKEGLNARTSMARIDYVQGKKEAASELVKIVLEKDPENLDAIFIRANLAFDSGAYQDAASDLHLILREKPHSKEALRLLGETLFAQKHLDLAIDTLNQILELDPLNAPARVRLAQLYHLNGDSNHAMDLLFIVTKTTPQYPLGWESTARIAIDNKDWATAQKAIDMLDTFDGQHITATFLRGETLAANGKAQEAIAQYTKVIDADPTSYLAELSLKDLVSSYKSLNHLDEAAHYIESMKTRTAVADTVLGECYLALGKSELAAAAFDAAIASHPPDQDPYLYRAKILMENQKDDQAIDTLKAAAVAIPKDVRAELLEAQLLSNAKRYPEAIAVYSELLSQNAQLDAAANNMAELIADYQYSDANELEKARQVAERFEATSNPLLLDTLAWIYYRQNNIQQAQTVMERVVGSDNKLPPEVHYHYGAILIKAGKTTEGKTELQQAINGNQSFPGLDDAKLLLSAAH